MSDLTSELNLSLAVDDDDTADYLTVALRESLSTLDGSFNASTGHNHNGSHQGGALEFQDLLVSADLTVVGATDLQGPAHLSSNLTVDGAATLTSLDVTTTSRFRGAATFDAGIIASAGLAITGALTASGDIRGRYLVTDDGANGIVSAGHGNLYLRPPAGQSVVIDQGPLVVTGAIQGSSYIAAGPALSGTPGDLSANRGGSTGYLFLGAGSRHVGFDGSNYVMPGANLYVAASMVATADNALTLNSKTLTDPKITNNVVLGGASSTLPEVAASAGKWRYIKAWGQNLTMLLTNGTLILFGVQYSSGQYVLRNGDSLSCYCDGGNWWVL